MCFYEVLSLEVDLTRFVPLLVEVVLVRDSRLPWGAPPGVSRVALPEVFEPVNMDSLAAVEFDYLEKALCAPSKVF